MRTAKLLEAILKNARRSPTLRKKAGAPATEWRVELQIVTAPAMRRLNARYRGKDYATDVLSFPAPEVFRKQGLLGELVICESVLKRQAKEHGHSERRELEVLLVHGVLHLVGLDHELGRKEALEMARWEKRLLAALGSRAAPGLIARVSH